MRKRKELYVLFFNDQRALPTATSSINDQVEREGERRTANPNLQGDLVTESVLSDPKPRK